MTSFALLLVPAAPLLAALVAAVVPAHRAVAAAVGAVPAIVIALIAPDRSIEVPWLLLGAELGTDDVRRPILLLAGVLWLLAAVYARTYHRHDPRSRSLFVFFNLTMAGNVGLIVAFDAVTFYLFFILMNLAAYGMIRHVGNAEAGRAGRVYITLVIIGEAFILPALWLGASGAESLALADVRAAIAEHPSRGMIAGLLFLGFGIKAGALPLHVWLPLAHPVAPTPASAVLSGSMIKAGLLAWLVFLPLAEASLPAWGLAWIILGLAAALFGAAVGIVQDRPKVILAYSSISQMGLMTVAVGLALAAPAALPQAASAAILAAVLYAVHHGFAKGALFLGTGVADHAGGSARRWALVLMALPALALAGLPPTTGLAAKTALKQAAEVAAPAWLPWLEPLLAVAAVGTTLVMARFLVAVARHAPTADHAGGGLWFPWSVAIATAMLLAWLPVAAPGQLIPAALTPAALISATWPVAVGAALAVIVLRMCRRRTVALPFRVPPGDILALEEPVIRRLVSAGRAPLRRLSVVDRSMDVAAHFLLVRARAMEVSVGRLEKRMTAWPIIVGAFGALLLTIAIFTHFG
ncbi:MAG: NADH-ubiquinone oxidoreductase [Rhodospirillales bacterium]|nr:MAG: NADH-ubiquinone oxidoreductase [Rhodospirillales bacterium]